MDNVTYNDDDPSWEGLTTSLVSDVSHGTLTFNSDGSFEYAPPDAWIGQDTFTYTVSNSFGTSNEATVTIDVGNDAPVAVDDTFFIAHDQMLSGTVELNDSDINADGLTFVLVSDVANGGLALNSDGTFDYTPAPGYVGPDSFTYQASDGFDLSNIATVTITVYNTAPVFDAETTPDIGEFESDGAELLFETGMILGQLNATDAESDPLIYSAVQAHDYIEVQADGDIVVTDGAALSALMETGASVEIQVQVTDGIGTDSSTFTLSWFGYDPLNQRHVYLRDSNGIEHWIYSDTTLIYIMEQIQLNGDTIAELIFKGHGSNDVMDIGDSGEYVTEAGDDVYFGDVEVTDLLKDITDNNTTIYLRGCNTYPLAKRIQANLDGASVKGSHWWIIGIPGTIHAFGDFD